MSSKKEPYLYVWNSPDSAKDEEAVRLRAEGLSFREIGERMGVCATMAHRRVKRAMMYRRTDMIDRMQDVRDIDFEKLRIAERALMPAVAEGDHDAIKLLLRIIETRRRYLKQIPLPEVEKDPDYDLIVDERLYGSEDDMTPQEHMAKVAEYNANFYANRNGHAGSGQAAERDEYSIHHAGRDEPEDCIHHAPRDEQPHAEREGYNGGREGYNGGQTDGQSNGAATRPHPAATASDLSQGERCVNGSPDDAQCNSQDNSSSFSRTRTSSSNGSGASVECTSEDEKTRTKHEDEEVEHSIHHAGRDEPEDCIHHAPRDEQPHAEREGYNGGQTDGQSNGAATSAHLSKSPLTGPLTAPSTGPSTGRLTEETIRRIVPDSMRIDVDGISEEELAARREALMQYGRLQRYVADRFSKLVKEYNEREAAES